MNANELLQLAGRNSVPTSVPASAQPQLRRRGELVIGARKESGNGHVVVVVSGAPLAHGKYPFAFWGKLKDPANAGFD